MLSFYEVFQIINSSPDKTAANNPWPLQIIPDSSFVNNPVQRKEKWLSFYYYLYYDRLYIFFSK